MDVALRLFVERGVVGGLLNGLLVARGGLVRAPTGCELAWHAPDEALHLGLTGLARKALRRIDDDRCSVARGMA